MKFFRPHKQYRMIKMNVNKKKMMDNQRKILGVMIDGRDYVSSELAGIVNLHQATVIRNLRLLEKEGKVKGYYWGEWLWRRI